MKLDPLFTVKNNKLYKIEDNTEVDLASVRRIEIPWTTVEMEDEAYNEEFLATLREELKKLELLNTFAIIVPVVDKTLDSPEKQELFINAYNHTARRIKDCISVIGMEIPAELKDYQAFIDTLSIKHAQYIYFSKTELPQSDSILMY